MIYVSTQLEQTEHLSQLTQADILDASEETYAALAEKYRRVIEVHRALCEPASRLMVANLGVRGHEARQVPRSNPVFHFYVELASEQTMERILIDPTWQQFLDGELIRPEMPKVLMGTGDEVVAAARSYGVESRILNLYRPPRTFD